VEIKQQVGETAGKVWHLLDEGGPQTLAQIKKRFNGSSEVVGLALGWLAREDKVEISQNKKTFTVALR
jgi:hypothetical protein